MKLRFRRRTAGSKETPRGESISQRAQSRFSPGCMAGFFGFFLLAGLGFLLFFTLPALKVLKARSWAPVDCEILSSGVATGSSMDGATYSIEVSYRYVVDGVEYTGDRYEFLGGSSSGYDSKKRKVDALPAGSVATCHVDPEDPYEVVLERGFSWGYLFAVLPLVFVAVGGGGVFWSLTRGRRAVATAADRLSAKPGSPTGEGGAFREIGSWSQSEDVGFLDAESLEAGPIELEEQISPKLKLVLLVGGTVFWNGILSIFVWEVWTKWNVTGSIDGCMTLFLAPFILVGLALLCAVPYQLLAVANPRPKLTLSRAAIPLGDSAQLSWQFTGSVNRLQDLRIWVEGTEKATYRRGTSSHTDSRVFATHEVAQRGAGASLGHGSSVVRIPADTMHTFDGGHNKIEWTLNLRGSIARWPDVITAFPLVVAPDNRRDR